MLVWASHGHNYSSDEIDVIDQNDWREELDQSQKNCFCAVGRSEVSKSSGGDKSGWPVHRPIVKLIPTLPIKPMNKNPVPFRIELSHR